MRLVGILSEAYFPDLWGSSAWPVARYRGPVFIETESLAHALHQREGTLYPNAILARGPLNIERRTHLKNARRETKKRKRGLAPGGTNMDPCASGTQGSSDAYNDYPNGSDSPCSGNTVPPSKKQARNSARDSAQELKRTSNPHHIS